MPRKNNPKQTIESIVSVSTKLFIENGYEKTSMQDIVNEVGMSKGAIFHHFKSKEDIFNAAMEKQFEQVIRTIEGWLNEMTGLTAKEKLRRLLKRNMSDETINESVVMVSSATSSSQVTLAFIQNNSTKLTPLIANILREGIDDGSITTEFPDECADVLLLLLNFWCDTEVFPGDLSVIKKRFQFLQYLMRQLGVDVVEDEVIDSITEFYQNQL